LKCQYDRFRSNILPDARKASSGRHFQKKLVPAEGIYTLWHEKESN
jgi:hypothetical protein